MFANVFWSLWVSSRLDSPVKNNKLLQFYAEEVLQAHKLA